MAERDHSPVTLDGEGKADPPAASGRSAYLGYVAHEVRNPLATALWCAELLGRLSPEDRAGPRGEKLAGMARRALVRLARLVEDHFLSERLEIDGLPQRREQVVLREALVAAAAKAAPAGGCAVEAPEALQLLADPAMLARALEALVAAAGREGAAVVAGAEAGPSGVAIAFRGRPLPAGALERPGKGSPSDPTGRSLGLLMAGEVARAHGGSLELEEGALVLRLPTASP
jgi:K+-sensing histidine kinase KdpD